MTFIQPNKNSNILNKILILFAVCLIFGGMALVALYNRVVNFEHGSGKMKAEFSALQSQNAEIKDKILKLLGAGGNQATLNNYNLIEDKKPQYLEINSKWSYASER